MTEAKVTQDKTDRETNVRVLATVEEYVRKQADGFISDRACEFDFTRYNDVPGNCIRYTLVLRTDNRISRREHTYHWDQNPMESLDIMIAKLTHMAVSVGLIQTTPKAMTHHITLIGSDGGNSEVQIDGHTLRGLYELNYTIDASNDAGKLEMGFSRSQVHLDQEFLPENLTMKIQGMDELLDCGKRLTDLHREKFKLDTYAHATSDDDTVALWQEMNDLLHMYKPLQEDGEDAPRVH